LWVEYFVKIISNTINIAGAIVTKNIIERGVYFRKTCEK